MLDKHNLEGADLGRMLRKAPMATLLMRPISREARKLEARLLEITLEWEKSHAPRKRRRRDSAFDHLKSTISAFAADLVLHSEHEASNGFCFRSLNRDFSETVAEDRQFAAVRKAWVALGYFTTEDGFLPSGAFEGTLVRSRRGWATRFRPTTALISLAAEFGITPDSLADHYEAETGRTFPIELRAKKLSSGQGSGRRMKLKKSQSEVQRLAAEVQEINQFLAEFTFSLGEPPKFRRIFNNGDNPGFRWDQGGRLYAFGKDSYQQKKSDFRKTITIDGEATVELDFRSSQLTIAYGFADERLPLGDLYEIEGLPRDVVKALVTAILGKGGRPTRWPREFSESYQKATGRKVGTDFKLGETVDLVLEKHPLLERLNGLGLDVYRLQYVESQILLRAMLRLLRESQAPSLPVHDCLIVRARDEERARTIMEEEFSKEVGFSPTITVK